MSLVMFDYDGVIVDSLANFLEGWTRACAVCGFEIRSPEEAIGLFDENVYVSMGRQGVDNATIDCILELFKTSSNFSEVELFPGMANALESIAVRNTVIIITSNLSIAARAVLERNKIHCVADVIGAEHEKSKIKKITGVTARFPELTPYYVGDTRGDMLEGREAGALTIGVTWGWHTVAKLREGHPDYLVNTPAELAGLFQDRAQETCTPHS
jgi:phosphoglycolate phosphatase